MNVLLLVQKEQRVILDRLYEGVAAHCNCDLRWLSSQQQDDLRGYFRRHVDASRYDRIIFFLRFKKEIRQRRFIRTVRNLVILEHDAYQNYLPGKYQAEFSRHYRELPWARVICSGYDVTQRLQQEGVDAVFVSKGYDQQLLRNNHGIRDIELGFVGSLGRDVYNRRRLFLEQLAQHEPLDIVRTRSGEEYLQRLNRIRFFVSADIGMGECMIKNFEAMACGCVLFAWHQGDEENRALGFRDMDNVVLYRSLDEFRGKLARLRAEPELAARIAADGQQLVEQRFRFDLLGAQIAEALLPPLRPQPASVPWWKLLARRERVTEQ